MDIVEYAKQQALLRRQAASLKNLILDQEPLNTASAAANRYVVIGKALDVYGMVLNGIDVITTVHEGMALAQSFHIAQECEAGLMTLKESAAFANLMEQANMGKLTSFMGAGRAMFAANVVGVLAAYVGVWMAIGGAWAAAKANILTDNAMAGASRGAVLGANDAGPHYAGRNFWMWAKPSYPMFREAEAAARNMHNVALVAGYAQGKALSLTQKGNLFRFIHAKMSPASQDYYSGSWSDWGPRLKTDYYIECGAIFRRELLAS
jgi:hypothetical protein